MTQTATKSENFTDFAEWGKKHVLPRLETELNEQEAREVAMLVFKFSRQSEQKINEADLRNLLEHRSPQHQQMTQIVNQLRLINDSFEPKHCETINSWVRKNILQILFKDFFTENDAITICVKLNRKKKEKQWVIHPNDFILIINEKDIAAAQKKVLIDEKEIKRRVNVISKHIDG